MSLGLGLVALAPMVVVVEATGAAQAAHDTRPRMAAVAPTGRIVATASAHHTRLVSMLPDGADRRLIVKVPRNAASGSIDVTDDGSMVAMTLLPRNRGHIYTVNSDGSGFEKVSRGGDDSDPTFDPTGARIAFIRFLANRSALMRMNTDGTGLTQLTGRKEPDAMFPSWSPDGQHIAFFDIGRKKQSIVLTDPEGTSFQVLRTIPRKRGQLFTLNWSPDSSKLVFARFIKNSDNTDLWTINADGSDLTRITDTPKRTETTPAYSPDGSAIACSVYPKSFKWIDVEGMDADGGHRHRIHTTRFNEFHVAWGD